MKKGIYKMNLDFGRIGTLDGKFIATDEQVETLTKSDIEVYFGEALGKHSEVFCKIKPKDITLITENEDTVKIFEDEGLASGYDPFAYTFISTEQEDEDMMVFEKVDKIILENK